MTTETSFIAIYIKDALVTYMRIQRPIIVRENHNVYGHGLEMTQHQQHLYECVQPLQGQITWSSDRNNEKGNRPRNNFADPWHPFKEKNIDKKNKDDIFVRVESLLGVFVLIIFVLAIVLWSYKFSNNVFVINGVYLSQFVLAGNTYTMQDAGFTNPVQCFAIASILISTSLLVGWQQNRKLKTFANWVVTVLFVSICLLQVLAFVMHLTMFEDPKAMSFTSVGLLFLHIVSAILTIGIFVFLAYLPEERPDPTFETENNFWLCVVEDLNTIVAYALIYRACDSQVSIHDDTTTFFDVMCIVLIGFLQHIANILMIFHAHIYASGDKTSDTLNNIARTRLLLFFAIGLVTIFLYLRIAPTYTEYPAGVMFEVTRSLALIAFISMNSLHSLFFELQGSKTTVDWQSSPAWKLMTTAFITLGSCILLVQYVANHISNDNYKALYATT